MDRLSINEMTTYRWAFEEDVANYAAAGFRGIGVWRQKLSDFGEERGAELLAEKGMRVSSLLWAGGFTGSEGASHRESIADAREAIMLAARLRAGCLIVYTGARAGHTHNHARRLMSSALAEIAPIAEEHGVLLAIEPMHAGCAAPWTFLDSLDEAIGIVGAARSSAIKLCFDTYHLGHDPAVVDVVGEIVPLVALVQLGDSRRAPDGEQDRCPLGEGTLPIRELVEAFEAGGYQGNYEIELMGEEIEASDYGQLLTHSRDQAASWLSA